MNLASIALDGLRKAELKLEKSGRELARLPGPPVAEAGDEAVVSEPAASLSASMTGLIEARQMYEANLKLISAEDELSKHTIDLIG
jgi:flagellar basal body rod protein FlgC